MATAQLQPAMRFQVTQEIVDTKSMLDETNFYSQRQGQASELTKKLTYILGSYKRNYPISLMTLGSVGYGIENRSAEIDDVQFTYPVMGRINKASKVYSTEYTGGDKPGLGNSKFYITFSDNWIKRFYTIRSMFGTQAYVHSDGEPMASGGFRYECQLNPAGPADWIDPKELDTDVLWTDMFTNVAESESRSTESKMVMPGSFKNQMGFMRAGFSWSGNAANKIMRINVATDQHPQGTEVWMDYAMWQFEERWAEECELYAWYSRYNRLADGTIPLLDQFTGKDIPTGSGLFEQINNSSTYSKLTYKTFSRKIGDALYGMNDTSNMSLTFMGGTGARREFHEMMVNAGALLFNNFGGMGDIGNKFITGSGYNLMLGGFFDGFYHIDGYTIKFKHNPIFDTGKVAQASPLHPESGLPLESYRMVFLDDSDVDGQPNIRAVHQKGRAYIDGVSKGLTPMPRSMEILLGNTGGAGSKALATVQDKAEYTRMKSLGFQIMRANRCFDLQCVAGL